MQISAVILLFVSYSSLTASAPPSELASRILNGYQIDISKIPYQAFFATRVHGKEGYCGAVIIHKKAALTATHCIDEYEAPPSRIHVGTSYFFSRGMTYDIIQVLLHQEYDMNNNDIAMLVTSPMEFDLTVKPVGFATPGFKVPDGAEAIVSGFGYTSEGGIPSEVLLAAKVQIVPQATCVHDYLQMPRTITPGMICAAAFNPVRDSCHGDSGGPLVANGTLIGLVSWGKGCGEANYPGVYTRVSKYYEWIQKRLLLIDLGMLG